MKGNNANNKHKKNKKTNQSTGTKNGNQLLENQPVSTIDTFENPLSSVANAKSISTAEDTGLGDSGSVDSVVNGGDDTFCPTWRDVPQQAETTAVAIEKGTTSEIITTKPLPMSVVAIDASSVVADSEEYSSKPASLATVAATKDSQSLACTRQGRGKLQQSSFLVRAVSVVTDRLAVGWDIWCDNVTRRVILPALSILDILIQDVPLRFRGTIVWWLDLFMVLCSFAFLAVWVSITKVSVYSFNTVATLILFPFRVAMICTSLGLQISREALSVILPSVFARS